MRRIRLTSIALIALATSWSAHAADAPATVPSAVTTVPVMPSTMPANNIGAMPPIVTPAMHATMAPTSPNGMPLPPHMMRKGTSAKTGMQAPMPMPASPFVPDARQTTGFTPAFVLKGLHLGLQKKDLASVVPALSYTPEGSAQNLEVGTYSCGVAPVGPSSSKSTAKVAECNFTLGGEPVQSMTLRYWGDNMTMASLTFAKNSQPKAQWQRLQDGINYKYSALEKPFMSGVWHHYLEDLVLEQETQNTLTLTHEMLAQSLYMMQETERMNSARKERQARAAAIAKDM